MKEQKKTKHIIKRVTIIIISTISTYTHANYKTDLTQNDIYTTTQYQQSHYTLSELCPSNSIEDAQKKEAVLNMAIQGLLTKKSESEQRYKAKDLFANIQTILKSRPTIDDQNNTNKECRLQYLIISLLEHLRKQHLELIDKHNLRTDFANTPQTKTIQGVNFKKELIKHLEKKHGGLDPKQIESLMINAEGTDNLSTQEKELAPELIKLTAQLTLHALEKMKNKGRMTEEDKKELLEKININYHANHCGTYHGDFKVRITSRSDGRTETHIHESNININGCYNIFALEEIDQTLLSIIYHELGGHFGHYIKDKSYKTFQDICWTDKNTRNNSCTDQDFVSDYATTSAYEDYAETFSYRRREIPATNSKQQEKYNYFNSL